MEIWEKIKGLRSVSKELYIYGAGQYGQTICKALQRENIAVDGFTVTVREGVVSLLGLPVLEFNTIKDLDIGIVVGVSRSNAVSVKKTLESKKFNMEKVVYGYELIDRTEKSASDLQTTPTIEITTRIGCKVKCRFCPQSTLMQNYFENDADRAAVMSMKTFSQCLEKMPQNCVIDFGGMSEPLLNQKCLEMMKFTVSTGRTVHLYTTLVGADVSMVEQLCEMPIEFITLHLADKYSYASIPTSDEYYKMVDKLINQKKQDGSPLVNMCSAQTEPDGKILEICEGKYVIHTTMTDRAGNLNDPQLIKKYRSGSLRCNRFGPKLDHNILLPDGTLLLCCMDYSMKHILGNLLENSYEEILNGNEMARIKSDMLGEAGDVLCRRCINAYPNL